MKTRFILISLLIVNVACSSLAGIMGVFVGRNLKAPVLRESSREVEIVDENSQFVEVVDKTQNAVVSVIISKDLPVFEDYYYNPFGENSPFGFQVPGRRQVGEEEQQIGAGTGFFVSSDGFIITNRHVVSDTEASYTVIMNNGDKLDAKVIDRDTVLDIAILKVDRKDLNYIKMGDSDSIKVGQRVMAIGNSLGEFSNTVSAGIISGLSRSIVAGSGTGDFETLSGVIQTDASINPGNSGGPLLDIEGNAIGVNVAVAQDAENIGFAIPINSVKTVVESVEQHGKIIRPYLGVRYRQITQIMKDNNNLAYDYGALVIGGQDENQVAVLPDSPAAKVGIKTNDIILEVNGVRLDEKTSLQNEIQKYTVGEEVTLKVYTGNEERDIKVKLEANENN